MIGICKLCLCEKELRHSHILPEFMYQNIYDLAPKRLYKLTININKTEESKKRIEQKGIREYLLCGDCEVLLSKYESYAAETIYSKNLGNKAYISKKSQTPDLQYFTYDYVGFSYPDFKIFLLSILWRILICKTFDIPNIDNSITEKLRIAINTQNSMDYDDFGCLIQIIKYNEKETAKGFILAPFLTNNKENAVLNILIDGFMYSFYLNSKQLPNDKKSFFLKQDGTMIILGRVVFQDKELLDILKKAHAFLGTVLK